MTSAFSRMSERILAHLGEDSVLRGESPVPPRKISVKHGVQFTGYGSGTVASNGDLVVSKSVATIQVADNPQVGDTLVHSGVPYVLDVLHTDNGYTRQFILRSGV